MRHKSDKHRLGGAEIKCVCVWGRINFDLLKCVGGINCNIGQKLLASYSNQSISL